MRRALVVAVLLTLPLHLIVSGQQPGVNTPVLPGLPANPNDPDALLISDLVGQRQVEPDVLISTRNPMHVMAVFNDYRAVDIAADRGQPGTILSRKQDPKKPVPATARNTQEQLRRLAGHDPTAARARAAAEATVGMSYSMDGGLTWAGALLPGSLDDTSEASKASGVYGLEAMTDPKTAAAPCGIGYVVFLAFIRGGENKIAVARYQDLNNNDGGNTWEYQGTSVLASGNVATNANFNDLPAIAVDVPRGPVLDPCQHKLYVGWTTFTGTTGATRLNFAQTVAGSWSWSNKWWNPLWLKSTVAPAGTRTNQGVALAVDPRPGLPFLNNGGGSVYYAYRSFNAANNAVFVARSTDLGLSFARPVAVTGTTPFFGFDQPTLSTTDNFPPELLAFRSNALPTLEVVPHPTNAALHAVYLAWAERANMVNCPGTSCGLPSATGDPAIVLTRSQDGGRTWSARRAIDIGDRDVPGSANASPPGFGHLPVHRGSGPQLMPKLVFGGGRFGLLYYEGRGDLVAAPPTAGLLAGMGQHLDARFALLDPWTGARIGTNQVSRYPIAIGAELKDGEQRGDIADIAPGVKALNERVNHPNSDSGRAPFIGDYLAAAATVDLVHDRITRRWRFAVNEADVPFVGFRVLFTDSRNQVPPPGTPQEQANQYPVYSPPGTNVPSCANPGSRNHDVIHALVDARLAVNAATTFKQLGVIERAFPVMVSNGTNVRKFFRLTFDRPAIASFEQNADLNIVDIELLPFSSNTRTVYLSSSVATDAVTVIVRETTALPTQPGGAVTFVTGGLTGRVTLNLDPSNDAFEADEDTETHTPLVTNPLVTNPLVTNSGAPAGTARSPLVTNPLVTNPLVTNDALSDKTIYKTTHVTWAVQNQGNVNSGYTTQVSVPNAEELLNGNYVFQLLIHKRADRAAQAGCETFNQGQDQIISTIPSPLVTNPLVTNDALAPLVTNPLVTNATFFAAPAGGASAASFGAQAISFFNQLRPPKDVKADVRADVVYITLVANQIRPDAALTALFDPIAAPPAVIVAPQAADIVDGVVQNGGEPVIQFRAPDLVVGGTDTPDGPVAAGTGVNFFGTTITNSGNESATAPGGFEFGVYLSTDPVIDRDDLHLTTSDGLGPIAPGGSHTIGELLAFIPSDTAPGSYYIGVLADNGGGSNIGDVAESSEHNNYQAVPITITGSGDLNIVETSLHPAIAAGEVFYRQPLHVTDGEGELSWSLTSDPECTDDVCFIPPLPSGLSLNSSTGVISGFVTGGAAAGENYGFYVLVTDSTYPSPQQDVQNLAIAIGENYTNMTFLVSPTGNVAPGETIPVSVEVKDQSGALLPGIIVRLGLHANGGDGVLQPVFPSETLVTTTNAAGIATWNVQIPEEGDGYLFAARISLSSMLRMRASPSFDVINP